jgi:branched-chain amino acid transport system ATP-binding protein
MSEFRPWLILQSKHTGVVFGGLAALKEINFELKPGIVKAIIGPNGAGKSTLLNVITGLLPQASGEIIFKGHLLNGLQPHEISKLGVARTFQHVETFEKMTVVENVMVGRHNHTASSFMACGFKLSKVRKEERSVYKEAMELLKFVGLHQKAEEEASSLPIGEQRMLEIARALASQPDLLCLDEPAAGLNESDTIKFANLVSEIKKRGIAILLIEHDMKLIMNISDEIIVLNYGQKIAEGTPAEIQKNPEVLQAYLGGAE